MGQVTNPAVNNSTVTVNSKAAGGGAMNPNILLFDSVPGTKSFTVPAGVTKLRRAAIGPGGGVTSSGTKAAGGGGYAEDIVTVTPGQSIAYVVGAPGILGSPGGTSSVAGVLSATGGDIVGNPGVGSGGSINNRGGAGGSTTTGYPGGGASGHRFGNGGKGGYSGGSSTGGGGGGWIQDGGANGMGGAGGVDGFGLGLIPGNPSRPGVTSTSNYTPADCGGYGSGGGGFFNSSGSAGGIGGSGGIGGGAGDGAVAGVGGGMTISFNSISGNGAVIFENVT